MRIVRSYTNVWKVEKMFYGVNDWHLPRPVPMMAVAWGGIFFVLSLLLNGIPPFIFRNQILMNHVALPVFFAWLMNKARFDGKTPVGFLRSVCIYFLSPRAVVRGKEAKVQDIRYEGILITVGKWNERGDMVAEISN